MIVRQPAYELVLLESEEKSDPKEAAEDKSDAKEAVKYFASIDAVQDTSESAAVNAVIEFPVPHVHDALPR